MQGQEYGQSSRGAIRVLSRLAEDLDSLAVEVNNAGYGLEDSAWARHFGMSVAYTEASNMVKQAAGNVEDRQMQAQAMALREARDLLAMSYSIGALTHPVDMLRFLDERARAIEAQATPAEVSS